MFRRNTRSRNHLWTYLQDYAEKHRLAGNGFGFGLFGPDDVARTLSARYYKDGSEILIRQGRGTTAPADAARMRPAHGLRRARPKRLSASPFPIPRLTSSSATPSSCRPSMAVARHMEPHIREAVAQAAEEKAPRRAARPVPDIVDSATRSRMMAGIRSTNTRPEIAIRKALHAAGFRYRLHSPRRSRKARHGVCPLSRGGFRAMAVSGTATTARSFAFPARAAISGARRSRATAQRDAEVRQQLQQAGWRVLTVWECAITGQGRARPRQRHCRRVGMAARRQRRAQEFRGAHNGAC